MIGRHHDRRPIKKGLMDVTLADRSYFPDPVAGKDVAGALVVSSAHRRFWTSWRTRVAKKAIFRTSPP